MRGSTHLAAGATVALLLADRGVAPAAALVVGSILPDIDSPKSIVGRHIPILPKLLPHRTITHSLLISVGAFLIHPFLALGILLHIGLDILNPKGVQFFWPSHTRIRVPYFYKYMPEDGVVDHIMGYMLFLTAFFLAGCLIMNVSPMEVLASLASAREGA